MEKKSKRGRPPGKSRCECSCISYLTTTSLLRQMMELVASGAIGHFWFVEHEPDEEAKKPHHHLRMTPPAAQGVIWSELCERVTESLPGESLPRKLVLSHGSVNDCWQDALLYARHDSRYLSAKGMTKLHVDYPIDRFYTDSAEWLEQIWIASDEFEPTKRRMSKVDVMEMLDKCHGGISSRELLRVVMSNDYTLSDFHLFHRYAAECQADWREEQNKPKPVEPVEKQAELPLEDCHVEEL